MQPTRSIFGLCMAAVLLTGCGGQTGHENHAQPAAPTAPAEPEPKETSGTFQNYLPTISAITYDPTQVPIGSRIKVTSRSGGGHSTVTIELTGLQPNRAYGAHVHVNKCGQRGTDAGAHYQEKPDPVKPSVDPAYANPQNEVWLDFTTDANGNGRAAATGNWNLDTRQDAQSVVIHAHHTGSEPGHAGEAGDRLACLTTDF